MWRAVASDVALHGLAYLGVLLVFTGIFGLLVFSWGEVGSGLQPLAEVALPAGLLGAGAVLIRRGSLVVGRALVLVGGAVVPLTAIASVADGSPVPPDAHRAALVVAAAVTFFAVALAYAFVATRRPATTLRYLVAPALWLGVAMVALAPRASEVVGKSVADPSSGQVAAVLTAVAATAWLARFRPQHPLARPTLVVSVAGLGVFGLLAVAVGVGDAWPAAAVMVSGLAVTLGLEAAAPLLPSVVVGVGQVVAMGGTVAVCATVVTAGWAGALGLAVFLAVLDWEGIRRPSPAVLLAVAGAAAVALGVAAGEPGAMVTAFGAATVWAHLARATPRPWLPAASADALAAAAPLGIAVGVFRLADPGPAAVTVSALVAAAALAVRATRRDDPLLRWWLPAAAAAVTLVPLAVSPSAPPAWLGAAAALGGLALAVSPMPVVARLWLVALATAETGGFVLAALAVAPEWRAVALGAAGLAAVAVAGGRLRHADHVGLAGYLATVLALPATLIASGGVHGWAVTASVALVGTASTVATWRHESGTASFVELLARLAAGWGEGVDRGVVAAITVVAVASVPLVAVSALDSSGLLTEHTAWSGVVLAVVGAVMTLVTRALSRHRIVAGPAADVGVVAGSAGAALAFTDPLPATLAASLLVLTCLAVHPSVRRPAVTWIGWAATALAAVRGAEVAGLPQARWHLALLVWSFVVVLGALGLDRARAGPRTAPGWIRVPALLAPATLGLLAAPIGLLPVYWLSRATWSWWSLAAAAATTAGALLTSTGLVSALSWVLLLVGVGGLAPFDPLDVPVSLVGAAAVPCAASVVLARIAPTRAGSANWDLPALVVGTATALVGVGVAVPDQVAVTWFAAGALAGALGLLRREGAWLVAAAVLVNGAATDAGTGWLSASLAATSVIATSSATRAGPRVRPWLQVAGMGAALGAFHAMLLRLDWLTIEPRATTEAVVAAALVGGAALGVIGTAARFADLGRDWAAVWAPGAAFVLLEALAGLTDASRRPAGLAAAAGMVLAAAGSAQAAAPLRVPALRHLAVVVGLAAAGLAWWGLEVSAAWAVGLLMAVALGGTILAQLPAIRSGPWWRPSALGVGLTAVGAPVVASIGAAGTGWLAGSLATLSVVATIWAAGAVVPLRTGLQLLGVASAWGAFELLLFRVGWMASDGRLLTAGAVAFALVGGSVLGGLGGAARWVRLARDWVVVWSIPGIGLMVRAGVSLDDVEQRPAGLALAAGLVLVSVGSAAAAEPLAVPILREATVVLALAAGWSAWWALDAGAGAATALWCTVALVATASRQLVAVRAPASPWCRPLALAMVLAVVGALMSAWIGAAGWGWLVVALTTTCLVSTVAATWTDGSARLALQVVGVAAAIAAFDALLIRLEWISEDLEPTSASAVVAPALAGGLVLVVLAVAARLLGFGRQWVATWAVFGGYLLAQCLVFLQDVDRLPGGLAVAAGLGLAALGSGLGAYPLRVPALREVAALLAVGAASAALWAVEATPPWMLATACAAALVSSAGGLWLGPARPSSPWRRPLDVVAVVSVLAALTVGVLELPGRGLLVAALLTAAAASASIGFTRRFLPLELAVPPLVCAAWLVYTSEALLGEPLWFTLPVGLALVAVAGIGRWWYHRLGGTGTPPALVAVEVGGVGALLVPPLVEVLTEHLVYGLVALLLSVGVAGWGVVTEVRRRVLAGVVGVVASVVLLIGVPLVRLLPGTRPTGTGVWLTLLGLGVVAVAVATLLERSRAAMGRAVRRVGALMRGWE